MSARKTLLMAGVFLAALCVYLGLNAYRSHEHAARIASKRLFSFDGAAVRRLEIQRPGEPPLAGERTEHGSWRFLKPQPTIRPFPYLWNRMAERLAESVAERTIAEPQADMAQYGLDAPSLTVLADTGTESFTLQFGAQDPTQQFRYARLNNGPVILVGEKSTYFEVNRSLDDLRHRFLMHDREAPLVRIEFARVWTGAAPQGGEASESTPKPGEESVAVIVARETPDTPWEVLSPVKSPADAQAVGALAEALQYGVCRDFIDSPSALSDYGLEPPQARLTLRDAKGNPPVTIFLGNIDPKDNKGGIFARWSEYPCVFKINSDLFSLLPSTPDAFCDLRLFTQQARELTRIRYLSEHNPWTLQRDENQAWHMTEPAAEDADDFAVSEYLSALKSVKGTALVYDTPSREALQQPEFQIELAYGSAAEPVRLRFRRDPQAEVYYLATQDTGNVVRVPTAQVERLIATPDTFRSRRLFSMPQERIVRIDLVFEGKGYLFEKAAGVWTLSEPADYQLTNQSDVQNLLDTFCNLRASQRSRSQTLPTDAMAKPLLQITLTEEDNGTRKSHGALLVGAPVPNTANLRFARRQDSDDIFVVSQEIVERVREALRGVKPR